MKNQLYCYKYPHPAVTVDCVIFAKERSNFKVLLIKRGNEPFKEKWALPGGFLNINESAEEGALRELKEETGISNAPIEQLHTFTNPDRDPRERVISIVYFALIELKDVIAGDDAKEANWFPITEIPDLAFDHELIIEKALKRLKEKLPDFN